MVVHRIKKVRKQRRSRTHGWGSPKKHRGAGSRGGRGNAGSGKKGQQKRTKLFNEGIRIGKHGFKRPIAAVHRDVITNINDIEKKLQEYVKSGAAKKSKDGFDVDASKLGYTKVLGDGKISTKMIITAKSFSKKAIEKIEALGGKAIKMEESQENTKKE